MTESDEPNFSLEPAPERLDDGTVNRTSDEATPLVGPSFVPKLWGLLLLAAIVLSLYAALTAPPSARRHAPPDRPGPHRRAPARD